jgi:hypothetical protein
VPFLTRDTLRRIRSPVWEVERRGGVKVSRREAQRVRRIQPKGSSLIARRDEQRTGTRAREIVPQGDVSIPITNRAASLAGNQVVRVRRDIQVACPLLDPIDVERDMLA